MEAIKQIKNRIYITYFIVCGLGIAIMVQVFRVQFVLGDELRKRADEHTLSYREIDAVRGNIYDTRGNLIVTSIPVYDLFVDINAGAITNTIFKEKIDSLSKALANLFKDKSWNQYRRELSYARNNNVRYTSLKKNVSYDDLQLVKKFPIFRLGNKYKGGLIIENRSKRRLPFGMLAARTLGRTSDSLGLEGSYNKYLTGVGGKRLMEKMSGNLWKPVNDETTQEPKNGQDIVSTIDINLQDVAENELMNKLNITGAAYGCVVLMEVSTGDIKAMANLTRDSSDGKYYESLNHAIRTKTEPGSTFKLMSLVAAMQDNFVTPQQLQDNYGGVARFCNEDMYDSHPEPRAIVTVQQGFEASSNVVIASVVNKGYGKHPQKLYDRFKAMHLTEPTGIDLPGEISPNIKDPSKKPWTCTTVPWMAHGYELELTPLQTLTFYNAIANNGKMMKPRLVKEIRDHDIVIEKFEPTVLAQEVCRPDVAAKARKLMEGVVNGKHGTAQSLKECEFTSAGKTGTAVILGKSGYGGVNGKKTYNASFCGYFPADKPKYSCIVFISGSSNGEIYGAQVALPVFKAVANKVYALDLDFHRTPKIIVPPAAIVAKGSALEIEDVAHNLGMNVSATGNGPWASASVFGKSATIKANTVNEKITPDVTGMSLKDALYLLENAGLRVKSVGYGKVVRQSMVAGSPLNKTLPIVIELAQ